MLRHVLDAVRGGETPDVVPPTSSVAGFAEFLAVEAVLDKRWPETRIAPTLERIADLVELLGDPQRGYPVVHIAGTNGKTSTARMVDALLRAHRAAHRPVHQPAPAERSPSGSTFDGQPMTPERYVEVYRDVAPVRGPRRRPPRHAAEQFRGARGDGASRRSRTRRSRSAVVEVGHGRAWDATNVADGEVAVITPIGVDHAEYLGRRLGNRAARRRGSSSRVRSRCSPRRTASVAEVLIERARRSARRWHARAPEFGVLDRELAVGGQRIALQGLPARTTRSSCRCTASTRRRTPPLALAAVETLPGAGPKAPLDPDVVRAAFAAVAHRVG